MRLAALLGGRSVATAESCTAGRIAEVLACVEKASEFLCGGLVAYQETTKRRLLGVTAPSVLTPEAAIEMALGAADLFGAEVAIATTGVAGDTAQDGTPPGTVYIAVSPTPTDRTPAATACRPTSPTGWSSCACPASRSAPGSRW